MVACAPWGAAGEFAASRHGALTRSQAAENGISRKVVHRLLRDRVLIEPVPGVLVVVGSAPTWRQRLYVATLASRSAGVAGFRSAAALHPFDGYSPGPVELLLPSGRRQHLDGVIHHRGPMGNEHSLDFTEVDGIPCTGVARTLCDLGSVDSRERVTMAFESAWRNGYSLTWMRQTAERLHRPGQRGTGVLLRLLDSVETRASTNGIGTRGRSRACPRRHSWCGSPVQHLRPGWAIRRPGRLRHTGVEDRHRGAQSTIPLRARMR